MTPRERVERLAREESTAIAVRAVRRMLPRAPVEVIERVVASTFADSDATLPRFTDEEIASAPADDEELRAWWRKTFEPSITQMFATAGEFPS